MTDPATDEEVVENFTITFEDDDDHSDLEDVQRSDLSENTFDWSSEPKKNLASGGHRDFKWSSQVRYYLVIFIHFVII